MARTAERLTALKVARTKRPGRYSDGGGLYLHVREGGARQWVFRFMRAGVSRDMGLGPAGDISLADAREIARGCRLELRAGLDPIEARKARQSAAQLDAARTMTFMDAAAAYIEANEPSWRNPKHRKQWRSTLDTYAAPLLGNLPVQAIDVALVRKVLQPIWHVKPETASRVRGRIETILNFATALKLREGPNPAAWKGNLSELLPKRSKVARVLHHPALPYRDVSDFMRKLRALSGTAPQALEFAILCASRSGEVRGARWSEIDFVTGTWTIPPERIKAGRQHRVPLSSRALGILEAMKPLRDERHGDYVFPGGKAGKPLSDAALSAVLDRLARTDITVHGFRSTFRDWCAEQTSFAREIAEACLAHTIGDAVERAYQRSDLVDKRRRLLEAWSRYCATVSAGRGKVVAMQGARA